MEHIMKFEIFPKNYLCKKINRTLNDNKKTKKKHQITKKKSYNRN